MFKKFLAFCDRHPRWTCFVWGALASLAMAPMYILPLMAIGLSAVVLMVGRIEKPKQGAWCVFAFGMGFFVFGLYWIANAMLIKIEDYWWVMGLSIFGLPLLLSICWFIAGWLTIKFSKPQSVARSILFLTLLPLAEYGRAYNLTGFPWNLFGYTWGFSLPMMQLASLGGAYLVTALTFYWMALPALAWQTRTNKKLCATLVGVGLTLFVASYAYGAMRLAANPTQYRDDVAVVIVQPNISQDEKWEVNKVLDHFLEHVDIMQKAMAEIKPDPKLKAVAIIWPETSIDESLIMRVPDAPRALLGAMQGHPYETTVISGLWRQQGKSEKTGRPNYYNSVVALKVTDNKIAMDALYDKHHLVPFGEFLPMENLLDLTPVVGFAGFRWGPGPKVLQSSVVPPFAPMICFEAIFPWYAKSDGAEWLVNTSNDGWYGDTPGPYQHLVMTRFRAVEQGKPIARSATTGISALIDAYGRTVHKLDYLTVGSITSALPKSAVTPTLYTTFGEGLFLLWLAAGFAIYALHRFRDI